MAWSTPKTNWSAGDGVANTDLNRIEGNAQYLKDDIDSHKADGTQHAKSSKFVVGTSTSGWTSNDCNYLCDGTADDVEINAAITALPVTGGEIIILDGTYNITAKIDVNKSNVSIRGNGNATILKRMWNSGTYDPIEGEWSGFPEGLIHLEDVSGCKIENLKIDGNNADYPSWYNIGIFLDSSSNNAITGNTCNNNNSVAISLNSSSDNTITGNICNNNSVSAISLNAGSNNTVTSNTCNENSVGIYLMASSNLAGSNNTVTSNTCNENSVGIYLRASSNNTVTGNTCNDNSACIYLEASRNNTVTGNTCNDNRGDISLDSCGISLNGSSNNTITGNTCIRGMGLTTDYTENQYTIYLMDTYNDYNLISSNNCMGKAVTSEGGTGNTLVNNKFQG